MSAEDVKPITWFSDLVRPKNIYFAKMSAPRLSDGVALFKGIFRQTLAE
jgi:hypothetical protein